MKRKKLNPNSILNQHDLSQHLTTQNILISNKHLETFYQLLHKYNYPALPIFVKQYNSTNDKKKHQLPHSLLTFLNTTTEFVTLTSSVDSKHTTKDTIKLVVKLQDEQKIETISMHYQNRISICLSSQVGCAMKCTFCATGTMGERGNLSTGEILEQVIHMSRETKSPIRNVVFMGMGEPLNNFQHVTQACRILACRKRWSLKYNRITISTVGVTPKIKKLTKELPQVNLALSLHAPNQALRQTIVPTATSYPLDQLMKAFFDFHSSADLKKRGMIEYIMINGPTSSFECAHQLGNLCREYSSNLVVNLIPYNATITSESYKCPTMEHILEFQTIIKQHYGVLCFIRRTMGTDISGACGQLVVKDIEDLESQKKKKKNPLLDKSTKKRNGAYQKKDVDKDTWMVRPLAYATVLAATCCLVSSGLLILSFKRRIK